MKSYSVAIIDVTLKWSAIWISAVAFTQQTLIKEAIITELPNNFIRLDCKFYARTNRSRNK
jgi:hypothetical protein